jgi:RNA-directed DNA polymerase
MPKASTLGDRSPGLVQGVERAPRAPAGRCHARAHLIAGPARERASRRHRANAAVGVDGVTKEHDGHNLEAHLQALPTGRKARRYRPQPIQRVHLPKAHGKTRPMGLSAVAANVGQEAVREVLEAVYAQDFVDCS